MRPHDTLRHTIPCKRALLDDIRQTVGCLVMLGLSLSAVATLHIEARALEDCL
jgi:hypothetical protein